MKIFSNQQRKSIHDNINIILFVVKLTLNFNTDFWLFSQASCFRAQGSSWTWGVDPFKPILFLCLLKRSLFGVEGDLVTPVYKEIRGAMFYLLAAHLHLLQVCKKCSCPFDKEMKLPFSECISSFQLKCTLCCKCLPSLTCL